MNENKLGSIISRLRKEKNITQKDLSNVLNISDKAISRWECGTSHPSLEMMFQISRYFNVSYNDLITARLSDDNEDNEIVENIVKEFQAVGKRKVKIIIRCLIITIILLLFVTMAFIFTNTYNRFKVYKVHSEGDIIQPLYGSYVETNVRDTLYLGDIKLKDVAINDTDTISVDLYFLENEEEKILQNYTRLENIYLVGSQSYIDINNLSKYFDALYLRITITDSKNDIKEYIVKLEFVLDFTNNKINYEDGFNTEDVSYLMIDFAEMDIEQVLLDNGFEKVSDDSLLKSDKNHKICYIINSKIIKINFENNNFIYKYSYHLNNNTLEVIVYDESYTIVQNYKYDIDDNVMDCLTGSCNDYKTVLKLFKQKVPYLFK